MLVLNSRDQQETLAILVGTPGCTTFSWLCTIKTACKLYSWLARGAMNIEI